MASLVRATCQVGGCYYPYKTISPRGVPFFLFGKIEFWDDIWAWAAVGRGYVDLAPWCLPACKPASLLGPAWDPRQADDLWRLVAETLITGCHSSMNEMLFPSVSAPHGEGKTSHFDVFILGDCAISPTTALRCPI